ncbi:hypothetical protein L0152_08555 [bacterium]|nr:hypothetical protein [bacterium]
MQAFKQDVIEFLKQEFHPDLDYNLHLETTFNNHPIKGAQQTELYSFEVEGETHEKFFVFAGGAHPMVYPDYGLTLDELWAVHLGLEYFIEQGVKEDTERKPQLLLTYLKMVSTVFQEQLYISKPDAMKIEKVYQLGEQRHIVGRAEFNSVKYSWIVGDITHFVYKKELPPQITWALHMGRILLT